MQRKNYIEKRVLVLDLTSFPSSGGDGDGSGHCCWVHAWAQCLKITQNVAFEFWHFPPFFDLLKLTCLVTLFDFKL